MPVRTLTDQEFPFCGPSLNSQLTPLVNFEQSINLYPELSPRGKSGIILQGRTGLSAPINPALNGAIRMLFGGNGRLFTVGGTHFYEIDPVSGAIIQDYGAMPGDAAPAATSPCTMFGNAIQSLVWNQNSSQIYFVNTGGFTMISEFNAFALEYLDGFFVAIATGASLAGANPNQVNVSNFNDGTTWNALNFVIKEGSSDAINGLANVNNLLWIFGQKNIEIWYNAGNPLFPFARVNGGTLNVGCMAPASIAKANNTVLWLGSDERGFGVVYMSQGIGYKRVSTNNIEQQIYLLSNGGLSPGTNAFTYQFYGHVFYVLNIPQGGVGMTLVYDLTTDMWHQRGFWNGSQNIVDLPFCFASVQKSPIPNVLGNYVGDKNGNIYFYTFSHSDNGTLISYERICPHIQGGRNRWIKYPWFEVDAAIGSANITLNYSNDGGRTFLTLSRPDATIAGSNDLARGAFQRFRWRQLGSSRDRVMRVVVKSNSQSVTLINGYLGAGGSTEQ
jgi:hypothetical protein